MLVDLFNIDLPRSEALEMFVCYLSVMGFFLQHEKYQPNPVTEDLWVSGRSEVPLNHIDLLPQVKVTSEVDRGSAKLRNGITHFNTATGIKKKSTPQPDRNIVGIMIYLEHSR